MNLSRTRRSRTIWLALIAVGLVLVLDVLYFVRGSLELYPTAEQQDKVRSVTGVMGTLLALVALGLGLLLRHMGRRSRPTDPGRPA
jgi:hypothetical protein